MILDKNSKFSTNEVQVEATTLLPEESEERFDASDSDSDINEPHIGDEAIDLMENFSTTQTIITNNAVSVEPSREFSEKLIPSESESDQSDKSVDPKKPELPFKSSNEEPIYESKMPNDTTFDHRKPMSRAEILENSINTFDIKSSSTESSTLASSTSETSSKSVLKKSTSRMRTGKSFERKKENSEILSTSRSLFVSKTSTTEATSTISNQPETSSKDVKNEIQDFPSSTISNQPEFPSHSAREKSQMFSTSTIHNRPAISLNNIFEQQNISNHDDADGKKNISIFMIRDRPIFIKSPSTTTESVKQILNKTPKPTTVNNDLTILVSTTIGWEEALKNYWKTFLMILLIILLFAGLAYYRRRVVTLKKESIKKNLGSSYNQSCSYHQSTNAYTPTHFPRNHPSNDLKLYNQLGLIDSDHESSALSTSLCYAKNYNLSQNSYESIEGPEKDHLYAEILPRKNSIVTLDMKTSCIVYPVAHCKKELFILGSSSHLLTLFSGFFKNILKSSFPFQNVHMNCC